MGQKQSLLCMSQLNQYPHIKLLLMDHVQQLLPTLLDNIMLTDKKGHAVTDFQLGHLNDLLEQLSASPLSAPRLFTKHFSIDAALRISMPDVQFAIEELDQHESIDTLIQESAPYEMLKSLYPQITQKYFKDRVEVLDPVVKKGRRKKLDDAQLDCISSFWQRHIAGNCWHDLGIMVRSLHRNCDIDYRDFYPYIDTAIAMMKAGKQDSLHYMAPYLEYNASEISWDTELHFTYTPKRIPSNHKCSPK